MRDATISGNLAVDYATLHRQGTDLTIHSVGGSATVSADYGDSSQITAASGSLVFGDIDGDFTVTALTSDPGSASEANDITVGGDLTVCTSTTSHRQCLRRVPSGTDIYPYLELPTVISYPWRRRQLLVFSDNSGDAELLRTAI